MAAKCGQFVEKIRLYIHFLMLSQMLKKHSYICCSLHGRVYLDHDGTSCDVSRVLLDKSGQENLFSQHSQSLVSKQTLDRASSQVWVVFMRVADTRTMPSSTNNRKN